MRPNAENNFVNNTTNLEPRLKGIRSFNPLQNQKSVLSFLKLFQLKLMATIHQTQPTIQVLLSTSDYLSALDLIDTSLEILQQELAGVQCFR